MMTIREAQSICQAIRNDLGQNEKQVHFEDVYDSILDLIDDLGKIYIPKTRVAPNCTFIGYEYIYSFAYYVQHGWKLSEKQITQCKRLAAEIKKAAAISEYKF